VHCEAALGKADLTLAACFNKLELPEVAPVVTRVECYAGQCRYCGTTLAPLPEGLEAGTPFSHNIIALTMYLRFVHHVSYRRLRRLLLELFSLTISERALDAALHRGKPSLDAETCAILTRLCRARVVVCSDETGVRPVALPSKARVRSTGCWGTDRSDGPRVEDEGLLDGYTPTP
jgi:transposase